MELLNFENLADVLQEFAVEVREQYKDNLAGNGHIASRTLFDSVDEHVTIDGTQYLVQLSLEEYWKYVENDTPAHWPPKDAILRWIQIKPILPRPDANGRIPSPQSLAFLIGRAMAGQSPNQANLKNPNGGTTGTHDLEHAKDDTLARFKERITRAMAEDLGQYIKLTMPKIIG